MKKYPCSYLYFVDYRGCSISSFGADTQAEKMWDSTRPLEMCRPSDIPADADLVQILPLQAASLSLNPADGPAQQ